MAVCSVVANNCLAPAGYLVPGRGYARGRSVRLPMCYVCDQPVCRNCSVRVGRSLICAACCEDQARHILG